MHCDNFGLYDVPKVVMDRSWINKPRTTDEYEIGVERFLQYAQRNAVVVLMEEDFDVRV